MPSASEAWGGGADNIRGRNQSPASLLRMAFGVQADQIINTPAWASAERFDISAKVAPGIVFNAMTMLQPMLRNLLEDRFRLKIHHETRELNVYRLVRVRADRLGPKLAAAPANACSPPDEKDAASLDSRRQRLFGRSRAGRDKCARHAHRDAHEPDRALT